MYVYNKYGLKNLIFYFSIFSCFNMLFYNVRESFLLTKTTKPLKSIPCEARWCWQRRGWTITACTLGWSYSFALMMSRIPGQQVMGTNSRHAFWQLVPGCPPLLSLPVIGLQPLFWITLVLYVPSTQCALLKCQEQTEVEVRDTHSNQSQNFGLQG